jgi:hypothetical protein
MENEAWVGLEPNWWRQGCSALPLRCDHISLLHIQCGGASGPRGSTGLVDLLRRDHVAHGELVSPIFFSF